MSDPSDDETLLVVLLAAGELRKPLEDHGFAVHSVRRLSQLTAPSEGLAPRAIVLGGSGLEQLTWSETIPMIRHAFPLVDVIVWSPRASAAMVRDALHAGVREVVLDRSPQRARTQVARIIREQQLLPRLASESESGDSEFEGMLSRSRRMHDLFDTAARVAASPASVLILGETGTGKELLARAIHRRSHREGRFVALNCGAVPETLIDSELFGHVEGAFTGATKAKEGLFRHADGGTLLLDEAGTVPLPVQYRLLRVLQEGAVRPVGGHAEVEVDVRVIAATSASLEQDVLAGTFREDLFYRLDVIRLEIPPLRDRHDDIIYLFAQFARRFADAYRLDRPDLTESFLDALVEYPWPGNVRQLENFTERLVLTQVGRPADADRFAQLVAFKGEASGTAGTGARASRMPEEIDLDTSLPMEEALASVFHGLERRYLEDVLAQTRGRVAEAADHAGVSRRTLSRMLKRLGIDKTRFKEPL